MTELNLHATPQWRNVFVEQVRIIGLSLRREALVFAVVLGLGTILVVTEIVQGGPGFDSNHAFPTFLVSFLIPFAVWRGDRRFGPAFLWTLPVERRRLALAKVFAGLVWTMAALAMFLGWLFALAVIAPVPAAPVLTRIPIIATIAMYLVGSAVVLGLRHPLRWLFGAAGLFLLFKFFDEELGRAESVFLLVARGVGAWQALPDPAGWLIATFLWLGAGVFALWAALSRHKENQ